MRGSLFLGEKRQRCLEEGWGGMNWQCGWVLVAEDTSSMGIAGGDGIAALAAEGLPHS